MDSMNLRYICCQPSSEYYAWQVEVMINNFKKMGVNPNLIDVVGGYVGSVPESWRKLQKHYNTVRFFFYEDNRPDMCYPPSVYFHLMKKHTEARPELYGEALFTHDCDILFTRPPQFQEMAEGDTWYMSDTNSYINYDYVVSKGYEQFLEMCKIVGIDPELVKSKNQDSGGAQYIVKKTTPEFWAKVEDDSVRLYKYFCDELPKWNSPDFPIQKWTAGMWAYLWNAFLIADVKVDNRLSFTWATNHISDIDKYPIFHNAGVTDGNQRMLYKPAYANRPPYWDNLDIDPLKGSAWYWKEIKETAKVTVL